MGLARYALVLAACSSKPHEDGPKPPRPIDATAIDAAVIDANPNGPKTGDLQIRVELHDIPIPMRASPGRTACKTPRAPSITPTTTFGIPDALVVVDTAQLSETARIVFADCAFAPRLVAGTAVTLESAADRPAAVTFAKRGTIGALDKLETGTPRPVQLPIAGHAVTLPLDDAGVYELVADGESAWLAAAKSAAVTDPSGVVLVKDLAPGKYAVTAWLPPRGGQAAKLAKGSATVVAGDLAELSLELK